MTWPDRVRKDEPVGCAGGGEIPGWADIFSRWAIAESAGRTFGVEVRQRANPSRRPERIARVVGTYQRLQRRDPGGRPYDELVPEPIAGLAVALRLDATESRLRTLDAGVRRADPHIAAMVRSLLGAESLSSEQIMELAAGRPVAAGPEVERRMRRFQQACRDGHRAAALDRRQLLRTHGRLVNGGGALRTGPAWTGSRGSPADAVFVGPPAEQVDDLLADLLAFIARDDLCPIAQAAIAYAQLEFIHPFPDGNGRMGRWLIQVLLRRRGVADLLVPPVGVYFAANPATFLPAHRAYRDGDAWNWCTFVGTALQACADTAAALLG